MNKFLVILMMTLASPLTGQNAERLMEKASAAYAAMEGICGEFHQTLEVPLLGQRVESYGSLCQVDPGYFRMVFSDPEGDRILADGEYLWIYTPSSHPGQAIRTAMGAAMRTVDFHSEFLDDPASKYSMEDLGREKVGDRELHGVRLIPLRTAPYASAEVWISPEDALVYSVRIVQENGSVRTIALSDLEVDPTMSVTDFRFDPPAGVTVITR